MGLEKHVFKMDINEFALTHAKHGKPRRPGAWAGKNQLLYDLGLPTRQVIRILGYVKNQCQFLQCQLKNITELETKYLGSLEVLKFNSCLVMTLTELDTVLLFL